MTTNTYDADSLDVLEGVESVRKRPGMYIGSTDSAGVQHLVWEIVDNSVDEALAGHASRIEIDLNSDGSVEVRDDGRGIPTGIHKKSGISGVELALTKLHAGGKFGGSGYKSAGGLHGVGSSAVNALSARLDATVYQNSKVHEVSFQRGKTGVFSGGEVNSAFKAKGGLKVSKDSRTAKEKQQRKTGTTIRWWHDPTIFIPGSKLDVQKIYERARTTAFLVPGLTIHITNHIDPNTPSQETFMFTGGLTDMVTHLRPDEPLHDTITLNTTATFTENVPVLNEKGDLETQEVERETEIRIALAWGNKYDYTLRSYVNVVNTPMGGTHVRGFERALTKTISETARSRRGILKPNEPDPTFEDIQEGLTAVIAIGLPEPQFLGQTKEALGTNAVNRLVYNATRETLKAWFDTRKNAGVSKTVLEKIVNAMRTRLTQRTQRELARRKTALKGASMPSKLVDCSQTGTENTELLICEGDSALGTLKGARDSRYQALLPIRGKILNSRKATLSAILANKEASDIAQVIGGGAGKDFDPENTRVNRVIICADADEDGNHIISLLITLAYTLFKPMIEQGRWYVAVPPLYIIKTIERNPQTFYAENETHKDEIVNNLTKKGIKIEPLRRLKGLGETDFEVFWETTLNPETRTLRQISIEDVKESERILDLALGKDVEPRKEWIMNSIHKINLQELSI